MTTLDGATALRHPPPPVTLAEAGLNLDLITQLVLKTLHFAGELDGAELGKHLGLLFQVIEPAVVDLKKQHHIAIVGGGSVGSVSYRYRITDAGRTRAALFLETSHYVGVAPVPLEQYHRYMGEVRKASRPKPTRESLRDVFAHLVISQQMLDKLGPAIRANHSMFLYGSPGNGKTVIAQAIRKTLTGEIAIPHALAVEGNIIRLFDPVNHEQMPSTDEETGLTDGPRIDRRWVRCRPPLITVGGELTLDALELSYSPTAGFYRAPVQAIANGGVLVIDDFGRQHCSPTDLLNRWIVPLESRVDFLTLQTGQKFELPFMVLMVFATNLKPADLVDEAFLRRIQYKILAESPTEDQYVQIFENYCRERRIRFDRSLVDHLLHDYYHPRQHPMRGCHPRDLIEHALSLADYCGQPNELTSELLESACATYFVDEEKSDDDK